MYFLFADSVSPVSVLRWPFSEYSSSTLYVATFDLRGVNVAVPSNMPDRDPGMELIRVRFSVHEPRKAFEYFGYWPFAAHTGKLSPRSIEVWCGKCVVED